MLASAIAGSVRLFRLLGITVYLHYLWFVLIVFYVLYRRGVGEYSHVIWNVAEVLSLYGIVLLHEFGHALACRSVGGKADTILLWPLGGIAFVQPPMRPGAWLWSIAAGPLVNVALVPVTVILQVVLLMIGYQATDDVVVYANAVMTVNLIMLVFNLLPIYPMDGGQIVQSLLWFFIGFTKSLRIVAVVGLVAAVALAGLFLYSSAYFGVFVAIFIGWQAFRGFQLAGRLAAQGDIR